MNTEQLRAEFEAWCDSNEYDRVQRLDGTGYNNEKTKRAWAAWQAGRAALQSQDREDAERYRLLRRKVCIVGGKFHILNLDPRYIAPDVAVELDAAIDQARGAQTLRIEYTTPPAKVPEGARLWLWRHHDHFLAFTHQYPCHPGGDPMTLGQPVGYAVFRVSHDRAAAAPTPQQPRKEVSKP